MQIHCDKVTMGSVRRAITSLCFSPDGAWLFAGTASGDVLTINVARKAVQVGGCACARASDLVGASHQHWQPTSCKCLATTPPIATTQLMHTIAGSGIGHMRLAPDSGSSLLVGALDGTLVAFDFTAAFASNGSPGSAGAVVVPLLQVPGPISSISLTEGVGGVLLGTRHGDIFR
jgi:hypothetical protein